MQARERVRGLEARPPVRKDPATPERAGWASKRTCAQAHLSAAAHRVIGMYLSHALSVSRRPRLLSVSLTVAVVGRVHAGDHSGAFRRAPCPAEQRQLRALRHHGASDARLFPNADAARV